MERLPGFSRLLSRTIAASPTSGAPTPASSFSANGVKPPVATASANTTARRSNHSNSSPPKAGDEIVGQLYNFTDKGERAVALRPEITPTLAAWLPRTSAITKNPSNGSPSRSCSATNASRTGRQREHFQFNADIIGETNPAADAELIALLIDTLRSFGLTAQDFVIRLSSRNAWQKFFEARSQKPEARNDTAKAYEFFQTIDKLERTSPEESEKKLAALGFSLADVNRFIESGQTDNGLAEHSRQSRRARPARFCEGGLPCHSRLAYYTGTVFEAFDAKGEFRAIAGGGRYDNLVKLISGAKWICLRSASAWAMSCCWNCWQLAACCRNSMRTWMSLF